MMISDIAVLLESIPQHRKDDGRLVDKELEEVSTLFHHLVNVKLFTTNKMLWDIGAEGNAVSEPSTVPEFTFG